MGSHSMYELGIADVTVGRMDELTVYNIRRLFANVGSEFMDLTLEFVGDMENPNGRRRIVNGLMEEDDDE